jgi:hypothetical protein
LVLLLVLSLTADECFDAFDDWDKETTTYGDNISGASAVSGDMTQKIKEARWLREQALKPENLGRGSEMSYLEIDSALARLPGEGVLYLDRAAMEITQGRGTVAWGDMKDARGIFDLVAGSEEAGEKEFQREFVASLTRVRANLAEGSAGRKRIEREICLQWKDAGSPKAGQQGPQLPAGLTCK